MTRLVLGLATRTVASADASELWRWETRRVRRYGQPET
jgi:hypothetical protein